MRYKTLVDPSTQFVLSKDDQWISPDGHSPYWRRIWNGTAWGENLDLDPDSLEEVEIEVTDYRKPSLVSVGKTEEREEETEDESENDDDTSTEGDEDEQGVQTEVSDSNGSEQGAGGKPEPKPQQRGERGKVRKGRKG